MHGLRGNGLAAAPQPKSPPEYPDFDGKRRELARIQVLETERGFLEEEMESVQGLQPASKSCKEIVDFVTCNADPLVPIAKKPRTPCCFWRWLCGLSCPNKSWICRCCCSSNPEKPCASAPMPECSSSTCFHKSKCSLNCCIPNSRCCSTCSNTSVVR